MFGTPKTLLQTWTDLPMAKCTHKWCFIWAVLPAAFDTADCSLFLDIYTYIAPLVSWTSYFLGFLLILLTASFQSPLSVPPLFSSLLTLAGSSAQALVLFSFSPYPLSWWSHCLEYHLYTSDSHCISSGIYLPSSWTLDSCFKVLTCKPLLSI